MLKINKEQMGIFEEDYFRRRIEKICHVMAKVYEDAAVELGADGVERRVRLAIEQAKEHGIEEPLNKERYVHLMFFLDREDFDTAPETEWAGQILGWPDADEHLKIAALEKRAQEEAINRLL